jgi:hypothetical protein
VEFTLPEGFDHLQSSRFIRKQVKPSFGVLGDLDTSVVDTIIHPMLGNVQLLCYLRCRQISVNAAWMGLATLSEDVMFQADDSDRAG